MIAIGLLFVRMLCDYFKPRHQLSVLQQRVPRRPLHLPWVDRALFIWLYRRSPRILDAITIIRPETILRLASQGFCRLLAMEVSFTPGPAADRQRGARPDPKNEP